VAALRASLAEAQRSRDEALRHGTPASDDEPVAEIALLDALEDDLSLGTLAEASERPHPPIDSALTGEEPAETDTYEPDLDQEDFNDEENFLTPTAGLAERRRELDRERADRELELGDEAWWMVCPRCGERLSEHEFDSIKVERCETCGAACFDRGEIDLLLSAEEDVLIAYRAKGLLQ